jgi:hypothetical protein
MLMIDSDFWTIRLFLCSLYLYSKPAVPFETLPRIDTTTRMQINTICFVHDLLGCSFIDSIQKSLKSFS